MVYPRKKSVPDHSREGAVPNTLFCNSENGWINQDIYLKWFEFFIKNIPPARPVLLIQDGHGSHISIELIEMARENEIHLLCLPAHTTRILQPLDVGVFKSFKSHFSKACHAYIAKHPGRVVTTDIIAALVAEAWPHSCTPVNILSGFKKCGIFPINPRAVSDRQLAPSRLLHIPKVQHDPEPQPAGSPLFTSEQEALYARHYQEGYVIIKKATTYRILLMWLGLKLIIQEWLLVLVPAFPLPQLDVILNCLLHQVLLVLTV